MALTDKLRENRIVKWLNEHLISWVKEHKITALFTALLILAVLFVDVFLVGNYFLGTPEFCALTICHKGRGTMAPYTEMYWESRHGKMNFKFECMECHGAVEVLGIKNPYITKWYSHATDGLITWVYFFEGIDPTEELELGGSRPKNKRCLFCHDKNAKGHGDGKVYPLSDDAMSKPIDVTDKFLQAKRNPDGWECLFCHAYITHSYDGKLLPTERGRKYNFTHPGFPRIDLGKWKQLHWHAVAYGEPVLVNGVYRKVDEEVCKICHQGELAPEKLAEKNIFCYGCHRAKDWENPEEVVKMFEEKHKGGSEHE